MNIINDPRFLNFVLLTLYMANAIRWSFASKADALYWAGAFIITTAVTMKH
jgi:hypothetical protein